MIYQDLFMNKVKAAADAALSRTPANRWGTVTNARNTDTGYEVKVMMQPENVLTGWLPVLSPMVGSGWGLVTPPSLGMQAFIAPDSGDHNHGVVLGLAYSTDAMPPQPGNVPVKSGQFALVHKNGSYLIFNDDDVLLVTTRDLTATVGRNATVVAKGTSTVSAPTIELDADGKGGNTNVNLKGNLHVSGSIDAGTGSGNAITLNGSVQATGDVTAGAGTADQVELQRHVHPTNGSPPSPGS